MSKYVGKYRVKAEIDQNTNDYCRDINGELCNPYDIYIKCANSIKVSHYGRDILEVYIPSIGRGRNILRTIEEDKLSDLIFDVRQTDGEVLFKVRDKNLEKIINFLKPQTSGASISPFSSRNLKINKYQYTNEQIEEYKQITASINKEDSLYLSRLNNKFLTDIICKKHKNNLTKIKADMKLKQLKIKDYIYAEGYEKEYLQFLNKEIKEYENNKNKD